MSSGLQRFLQTVSAQRAGAAADELLILGKHIHVCADVVGVIIPTDSSGVGQVDNVAGPGRGQVSESPSLGTRRRAGKMGC